jgi:Mlc titration factor MtfA (ptsG expression regulator)
MTPAIIAGAAIVPIVYGIARAKRRARRKRLMSAPLPQGWEDTISKNIALYNLLPGELQKELHGHLQIIKAEKNWEGCGGLELTEDMQVIISAEAAILLLGQEKPTYFPKVDSILVYPTTYTISRKRRDGYIETESNDALLGESWERGTLVLAWDSVKNQARDLNAGDNVVLHEFAHQLDQESGGSTGTPILGSRSSYAAWGRVMSKEFEALKHKVMHHMNDVLRAYGATNPAEFFAVATEVFFDRPHKLKEKHPELYEQLKEYYKLDPESWKRDF